jgi:hypothetical protein
MAETQWDGIVVRCSTSETGDVPRTVTSSSPDIICNGTIPLPDPSILTDPANYSNAYGNNLQEGVANYLYVRGKNFTTDALAGSWNLFYAPSNILLYPYLWEKNQLATSGSNKNPPFTIDAGKIGASEDSFVWVVEAPPSGSHYCMIAVAITPEHGNPVSGLNTITGLAEYLANNGNIAQRNTHLQTGKIPDFADASNYDQGAEGALVDIATVFSNIPKGSSYTVACGTPVDGKTLSHSETSTTDNDFKYAWTDINMPANWSGLFNYSLKFGSDWSGIPPGKHPTVQIRGELVQASSDPLYHLGREADLHPITGEKRLDMLGQPVRIITVGTYQTVCPDVNPNK